MTTESSASGKTIVSACAAKENSKRGLLNMILFRKGHKTIVNGFKVFTLTCYADCRCCDGFRAK